MPGKGKSFNPKAANLGPKPPCGKDCPDRKAGCAINCEKWKAYLVERNANYEKRREDFENGVIPKKRMQAANRNLYRFKKTNGSG